MHGEEYVDVLSQRDLPHGIPRLVDVQVRPHPHQNYVVFLEAGVLPAPPGLIASDEMMMIPIEKRHHTIPDWRLCMATYVHPFCT
jgi:hypothetical protein